MMAPQRYMIAIYRLVTGQLADTPTHRLPTRGLDNSRSHDAAERTKTKHAKSPVASASCPVREMSSSRVVQSASWCIRDLSSNLPFYNKHIVHISSMYEFCAVSQSQTTNASCFLCKSKNRWGFQMKLHYRLTRRFKYVNSAETGDWNLHFCTGVTGQGNHFEFIPTV